MEEADLSQPAIVFWTQCPGGGEITRFDRLRDAIDAVMQTPFSRTDAVAWISLRTRHLSMDEIRLIAGRSSLTWRLSLAAESSNEGSQPMKHVKKKRFWWPALPVPQS
jgi:hypothetical protein